MEDFDKAGGMPVLLKALGADARPSIQQESAAKPSAHSWQNVAAPGDWQTAIPHLGRGRWGQRHPS